MFFSPPKETIIGWGSVERRRVGEVGAGVHEGGEGSEVAVVKKLTRSDVRFSWLLTSSIVLGYHPSLISDVTPTPTHQFTPDPPVPRQQQLHKKCLILISGKA